MELNNLAAPGHLQAAVDAILSETSSDDDQQEADASGSRRVSRSPSPRRSHGRKRRHKRARSTEDGSGAEQRKRRKNHSKHKRDRRRRSPTAALAQDDFAKGLQIQIEYARAGRASRVDAEQWRPLRAAEDGAPDGAAARRWQQRCLLLRLPNVHVLTKAVRRMSCSEHGHVHAHCMC
jgi:hypothetical protein